MKVQLGLVLSFLTISVVLAQISFASPNPDRHERNKCRPPSCTPQRREPGKKISEKDEVPVEGNSLDQSSTTENTNAQNVTTDGNETKFENLKTENATEKVEPSPSSTTEKEEVVSQNSVSSTTPSSPIIANGTEGNSTKSEPLQIPSKTPTDAPAENMENATEIQIPVEVKIIPPSRDELGGLTGHCPKEFRYHNESGMCFIPGEGKENACGKLMQFNEEPGSDVYGQCDCKAYDGCDFRPLLYYPQENRCFHLFEQGPCKTDEWLIPGEKNYEATCSSRTCPAEEDEKKLTWFTLNGTCYQTSTTAFCKNPLETAQYEQGKIVPTCSLIPINVLSPGCARRTITLGAVSLPCPPGTKSTGSGSCGSIVGF